MDFAQYRAHSEPIFRRLQIFSFDRLYMLKTALIIFIIIIIINNLFYVGKKTNIYIANKLINANKIV